MKKISQGLRLLRALWNFEPAGHIKDLWDELTGRTVVCGQKPYQYLMVTVTKKGKICR